MIALLFLLVTSSITLAELKVREVDINCSGGEECKVIRDNMQSLRRKYTSYDHLRKILKFYMGHGGLDSFYYELIKSENSHKLNIYLNAQKRISEMSYSESCDDKVALPANLPLSSDDYFSEEKVANLNNFLVNYYRSKGYVDAVVSSRKRSVSGEIHLRVVCSLARPQHITKINFQTTDEYILKKLRTELNSNKNRPFDIKHIQQQIYSIQEELRDQGFYFLKIDYSYKQRDRYSIQLDVGIEDDDFIDFDIGFNQKINRSRYLSELKAFLKTSLKLVSRVPNTNYFKKKVDEFFKAKGYLKLELVVKNRIIRNFEKKQITRFRIDLRLNDKTTLESVSFVGSNFFKQKDLINLFNKNRSGASEFGVFDEAYINAFKTILRKEYITRGFVSSDISDPIIKLYEESNQYAVIYKIREGVRGVVLELNWGDLNRGLVRELEKVISFKKGDFFDPITFENDLVAIHNFLYQQGYYDHKFIVTDDQLVTYSDDLREVRFNFKIDLGKRYFFNKLIIIGNNRTNKRLFARYLQFKEGDILTPKMIESFQTQLVSMGLFSSVNVTPVTNDGHYVDLLVNVYEKDFGALEIAPGFRTDLGFKVSSSITYSNLDGFNKKLSLKAQANRRVDLTTIEEQRREETENLTEYQLELGFSESFIFDSMVDFDATISTSRKRFFSFDADIWRIRNSFSRRFTNYLTSSITYQFETISQYNTIEQNETDRGSFQVGAITPTVVLDFRDNPVNPLKGSLFDFSLEVANPTLLSLKREDLEINYYKFVSRSRFYFPLKNGVFATSLAVGVEQNLATRQIDVNGQSQSVGYVPNIKVFRLTGIDIVRGFEDEEVNRLISGQDISDVRIDDSAYMFNLKLEPRFFISDSMMVGVFYDAGRVFVDNYDLNKLRSSVGITYKYLTPVGSIDIDYGIKLLRERDNSGNLESPGRLHVSIGFF